MRNSGAANATRISPRRHLPNGVKGLRSDPPRSLPDAKTRTLRLLLWRMATANDKEREKIRVQLMEKGTLPIDVVLGEVRSPSSAVRLEALRIIESRLSSSDIEVVLPLLYDHNVDVREQNAFLFRHRRRNGPPRISRTKRRTGHWLPFPYLGRSTQDVERDEYRLRLGTSLCSRR